MVMRCELSIELLNAYLDNELDEKQRLFVESHLRECPQCRVELEELKGCDQLLKQREIEDPTNKFQLGFENRLLDRIRTRKRPSWVWRLSPILVPVASCALVIFVVLANREKTQPMVGIGELVPYTPEKTSRADEELHLATVAKPDLAKGGVSDRSLQAEGLKEGMAKKSEAVSEEKAPVVASKTATPAAPAAGSAAPPAATIPAPAREKSRDEELLTGDGVARTQAKMAELNIPKNKVVRAIVDSTGRVVRVVTGNTIEPEEDKALKAQLEGQQLAPRAAQGQEQNLLYLDLTRQADTDSSLPDTLNTEE
jgi:hypothetical protein